MKDNERNQDKLLAAETCNTKLIRDGMAQHRWMQQHHNLELQLLKERHDLEKEDRNRGNKIAEEQRQADNILQQRRFNAEQTRIQN